MAYTCSLKIIWAFEPPYTEPYDPIVSDRLGRAAKLLWDDTLRNIDPERIEQCQAAGSLQPVTVVGPAGMELGIDIPTMKNEIRRRLRTLGPDIVLDIVNIENSPVPYRYLIDPPTCIHSYALTLDGERISVKSAMAPTGRALLAAEFSFTRA